MTISSSGSSRKKTDTSGAPRHLTPSEIDSLKQEMIETHRFIDSYLGPEPSIPDMIDQGLLDPEFANKTDLGDEKEDSE